MDNYSIPLDDPSPEFLSMFLAAGRHLQGQLQGDFSGWLKVEPKPPFLEHLSFALGNQVFFIRIEDADGRVMVPGARRGLLSIAEGWGGYPCLFPMKWDGFRWQPAESGWGLLDARNSVPVEPFSLITSEKVEVTAWELHDFAVQVVSRHLIESGDTIISTNSNPDVHPNIWFVREGSPQWVMVKALRYPERTAEVPSNWQSIANDCAYLSIEGNFAVVSFRSHDHPHGRILCGHAADVQFDGLIPMTPLE